MLSDEGRKRAAHHRDAETDPIEIRARNLHQKPGDPPIEPLLDDGNRQHERAHDEQHRIRHQALRHPVGAQPQQHHFSDDDEKGNRRQGHRLGDEQDGGHGRHREHCLAFGREPLRRRQVDDDEADQQRDEEPLLLPEVVDVELRLEQKQPLVTVPAHAHESRRRQMRLQAVASKRKRRRRHRAPLARDPMPSYAFAAEGSIRWTPLTTFCSMRIKILKARSTGSWIT
jgi:hypothetical protein